MMLNLRRNLRYDTYFHCCFSLLCDIHDQYTTHATYMPLIAVPLLCDVHAQVTCITITPLKRLLRTRKTGRKMHSQNKHISDSPLKKHTTDTNLLLTTRYICGLRWSRRIFSGQRRSSQNCLIQLVWRKNFFRKKTSSWTSRKI